MGVVSFVKELSVGVVTPGVAGGVASTPIVIAMLDMLALPAASVCMTESTCEPSDSELVLHENVLLAQVAMHSVVEPSVTATTAPLSQLPVTVVTAWLPAELSVGLLNDGVAGAVVSTVSDTAVLAALVLLPVVWVAVIECTASLSALASHENALLAQVALHTCVAPSNTLTVAPV